MPLVGRQFADERSINTVKGYATSLYRKLDVTTRQEAVERGQALKLI